MAEVDQALRLRSQLAGTVVARPPVVDHRRVEGGLVQLVLEKDPPVVGERVVDRAHAVEISLERLTKRHLPRKVAAVADPHRQRLRSEHRADPNAFEVVLDGLAANRGIRMRQAAVLVREWLTGLVLKGVRVHRIDVQSASPRERPELGRAVGLVPRNVQRDARRRSHQSEERGAVVDLLEYGARLAWPREPREPGAAGADAPGRHRHSERQRPIQKAVDVDPAAGEVPAERLEVLLQRVFRLPVLEIDELFADEGIRRHGYLRKPSCSPPSTGMMCPVVFDSRCETSSKIASA